MGTAGSLGWRDRIPAVLGTYSRLLVAGLGIGLRVPARHACPCHSSESLVVAHGKAWMLGRCMPLNVPSRAWELHLHRSPSSPDVPPLRPWGEKGVWSQVTSFD